MRIIFITLSVLLFKLSNSQNAVSAGPQFGIASKFSRFYNTGFGGSFEYTHRSTKSFAVRAALGYEYFKSELGTGYKSFLPLRVGAQGYLAKRFFLFGELGVLAYNDVNSKNETGFSYAAGTGYQFPLTTTQFLQLSTYYNYFRYTSVENYSWFTVRAAYGIRWGKSSTTSK